MTNESNSKILLNKLLPSGVLLGYFILAIWFVINNVVISSDMRQFLPRTEEAVVNSADEMSINPIDILNSINEANSDAFLLAISGGDLSQRASASNALRKALANDKLFIRVLNGANSEALKDIGTIKKYRYLLSSKYDENKGLNADIFSDEIAKRYQELSSPFSALVKKTLKQDPTAEVRHILRQWNANSTVNRMNGIWFSGTGSSALLVADINIEGTDINTQQRAIKVINTRFNALNIPELKLSISGVGVFAVQARNRISSESKRISIVASIGILLIIFWAYRSFWLAFLAGLPLISAVLAGVISTQLIFNSVHGITIAFGLTLLGIALDYPVHIFSHVVNNENVLKSVKKIWPTLQLGVVTTCVGFLALTQTNFSGLAQLGVFAVSGLIMAAFITRTILPSMLTIFPEQLKKSKPIIPGIILWLSENKISLTTAKMILLVVAVLSLFLFFPLQWESNLAKLSPSSTQQLNIDRELRKELAADDLVNVAIVTSASFDGVLYKLESLNYFFDSLMDKKIIKSYRSPHQLLPSRALQLERQNKLPTDAALLNIVDKATKQSPFKKNTFKVFINDVQSSRMLKPLEADALMGTLLEKQLSSMLIKIRNNYVGIIRFVGVTNSGDLERAVIALDGNQLKFVNIKNTSQQIIDTFRDEALYLFAIGLAVIFMALILSLQDKKRLRNILFIITMALASDLLLLNILGQSLSLFHLVSLLLVLGLGLDYSLFFTRESDNKAERLKTVHGIVICFASTVLVFTMLAISSIPVLSAIGLTVVAGVIFSFFYSAMFNQ